MKLIGDYEQMYQVKNILNNQIIMFLSVKKQKKKKPLKYFIGFEKYCVAHLNQM